MRRARGADSLLTGGGEVRYGAGRLTGRCRRRQPLHRRVHGLLGHAAEGREDWPATRGVVRGGGVAGKLPPPGPGAFTAAWGGGERTRVAPPLDVPGPTACYCSRPSCRCCF